MSDKVVLLDALVSRVFKVSVIYPPTNTVVVFSMIGKVNDPRFVMLANDNKPK